MTRRKKSKSGKTTKAKLPDLTPSRDAMGGGITVRKAGGTARET